MKEVIRKTDDGSILIDMREIKYLPGEGYRWGASLLVVIPQEVEGAELNMYRNSQVSMMGGCSRTMQARKCGGVERFATRSGREALKILPGDTHLLVYGRALHPHERVTWTEGTRYMADYWEADLVYAGERGNSIFVLRVAEIELLNLE